MAANSVLDFYSELDQILIQLPGGEGCALHDSEALLRMLRLQYPNWKNKGHVSSNPIARVPKLFLKNIQMRKELQKELSSSQKGDDGEIKVYKLLMETQITDEKGLMIFPNVNGREMFTTEIAHVEIDAVLAHPSKGIFVFNVKNKGPKAKVKMADIQDDFKRHCRFIQILMNYNSGQHRIPIRSIMSQLQDDTKCKIESLESTEKDCIPIYSVMCQLQDDNKSKFENSEKVLVFTKKDLQLNCFASAWNERLKELPKLDSKFREKFEILVARLVALNSLEGSPALIHNKLSSNYMQGLTKNKGQFDEKDETKLVLEDNSRAEIKEHKKYIIWTEEQLKIISTVVDHFENSAKIGHLKLIVSGCKGSGKTMLLVFLAKVVAEVVAKNATANSRKQSPKEKILVINALCMSSIILTETIKQQLQQYDVTIFDPKGQSHFYKLFVGGL